MGLRYNNDDEERVPKFGQGGVLESLNVNNNANQSGPASTGSSSNQGDPRKKVVINFADHYNQQKIAQL